MEAIRDFARIDLPQGERWRQTRLLVVLLRRSLLEN